MHCVFCQKNVIRNCTDSDHAENCPNFKTKPEQVDHPPHYGGDVTYEVIKVLEAWLTPEAFVGFCVANAMKYLARAGKKDKDHSELDYKKAIWYIDYAVDYRKRLIHGLVGEGRYIVKPKTLENMKEEQRKNDESAS